MAGTQAGWGTLFPFSQVAYNHGQGAQVLCKFFLCRRARLWGSASLCHNRFFVSVWSVTWCVRPPSPSRPAPARPGVLVGSDVPHVPQSRVCPPHENTVCREVMSISRVRASRTAAIRTFNGLHCWESKQLHRGVRGWGRGGGKKGVQFTCEVQTGCSVVSVEVT